MGWDGFGYGMAMGTGLEDKLRNIFFLSPIPMSLHSPFFVLLLITCLLGSFLPVFGILYS
jgi:hypothetical protein